MSDTNGAPAPAPSTGSSSTTPSSPGATSETSRTPDGSAPNRVDQQVSKPKPVSTEGEPAPKPEPKRTTREAIAKATKDVEAQEAKDDAKTGAKPKAPSEAPTKADPKAKAPAEREPAARGEHGHFASRKPAEGEAPAAADPKSTAPRQVDQGAPDVNQAPRRFSPEAQQEWANVPDTVKHEVHRATRELEQGIERNRHIVERDAKLAPYYERAQRESQASGREVQLDQVLHRYTTMEDAWTNPKTGNPVNGFLAIAANLGMDPIPLVDMIHQVLHSEAQAGRLPTGAAWAAHAENVNLRAQAAERDQADLKGRVDQHVGSYFETNAEAVPYAGAMALAIEHAGAKNLDDALAWAKQAPPDLSELAEEVATIMRSGRAKDLRDAYVIAKAQTRGRPSVPPAPAPDDPPSNGRSVDPDPAAQTRRGSRSVSGAPGDGSDPSVSRKASNSIRQALEKAAARAG